ncbi:DGQHR domain-containing protein [Kluyvera ascorbata]|uniref:DGQHR domain-containing protein n=1 Tax=Kluyvera ascorbata TaxID=51288 RepID=UPI002902B1FA|nr:DGQHR domain-containing protein [Kluyvera ascorbata]MDU1199064.1 DGQHR domain-containing protein [Kluyvera ascorbata]
MNEVAQSPSVLEEHVFQFPAVRTDQGGRVQYMLSAPMSMLKRILAFDAAGDVMSRSQRELNAARAKKITRYLTDGYDNNGCYLLPTLVGNIDAEVKFVEAAGVGGGLGTLHIPMDADIRLFDGQHRSRGIIDFMNLRREATDKITLLLTVGISLKTRQQFFSDINNNASKPATAISMAYNHKDPVNDLVLQVVNSNAVLHGRVDFEHNVVPSKCDLLISFKAIHDATRKMFGLKPKDDIKDDTRQAAVMLWKAWTDVLRWEWMVENIGPAAYRSQYIGTHGVMINAIGVATAMMLEHYSPVALRQLLLDTSRAQVAEDLELFAHANWQGVCIDSDTGAVKCDVLAQNRAAEKLLSLFKLIPEDPNGWLRECFDDTVTDAMVSDMVDKIVTVATEMKLDIESLKNDVPERIAGSDKPLKDEFLNIRRLRGWFKKQFPQSEAV